MPDFGTFLLSNFLADVKADLWPDAQAILGIIAANGFAGLMDPANSAQVLAFLVKAQADALKVGQDLSKQIATYLLALGAAKFGTAKTA